MPRRPGGGPSPHDSVEAGLRDLVRDAGPDFRKLSRDPKEGLRTIMQMAQVPAHWQEDAKAAAVLSVIQELVEQIDNQDWRVAAMAAFRLPAADYVGSSHDSLAGRWRSVARRNSDSDQAARTLAEGYRGYWIRAAPRLAERLERRFADVNGSATGWDVYRKGAPQSPPRSLPVSFDHTDVLYRFDGYKGTECISYRWLTANAQVAHFEAVGWYYNEPDAPVEIVPLANCQLDGPLRDLPQGGRSARLRFARPLEPGDRYFFAYSTKFNSELVCRPTILWEVRGHEMHSLIVRAQFDIIPARCWRFDVEGQNEGWDTPETDAPELLEIAANGYVEYKFQDCERGRKYGLRWEWNLSLHIVSLYKRMKGRAMGGD